MNAAEILNLTFNDTNPLSARQLGGEIVTLANALALAQSYSVLVLQQPLLEPGPSEMPEAAGDTSSAANLKRHQLTLRDQSRHFLDAMEARCIGQLTSIGGIASKFKVFLNEIDELLPYLGGPSSQDARTTIVKLLRDLEEATTGQENKIQLLRGDLDLLQRQLADTQRALHVDVAALQQALGAKGGTIDVLQGQIDDTQRAIRKEIAGLIVSGLTVAGGVSLIVVGVLGTAPSGGSTTPIILAGIGLTAGAVAGGVAAAVAIANDNGKLLELFRALGTESATLACLTTLEGPAISLEEAATEQVHALGGVELNWSQICHGVAEVRAYMQNHGDADIDKNYLRSLITLAGREWTVLGERVQQVQRHLAGFDVQQVDEIPRVAPATLHVANGQ